MGEPIGSQGGPKETHGAMDPDLWGRIGQGTQWPKTQGLRGSGALGPAWIRFGAVLWRKHSKHGPSLGPSFEAKNGPQIDKTTIKKTISF